ncbi:MAG: zinc ABC transporter substrate-binding protein [Lachnospiraceae bacterium]|nr:zinc ABC transporter substrate-binding protein [Lachnospiraceae bacterium]
MNRTGRKITRYVAAFLVCILLFTGCGAAAAPLSEAKEEEKIRIVTSIFPEYDWARNIVGDGADKVDLTLLLDNGVDLHSYQPTAADMLKITDCELLIYVGGESDGWIRDALVRQADPERKVLCLMDLLGENVKEEEIVPGMEEHEHEHEHEDHDAGEEEEPHHDEEAELDEHVWLSLKNAVFFCEQIAAAIGEADPEHAQRYQENLEAYTEKLKALDMEYEEAVSSASGSTLLFGDRFPFRYLTDDYGLSYYAAFPGCSAETEASFETIAFLSGKADELSLPAILTIEGSDGKIAETIAANTSGGEKKILSLNSIQQVRSQDIEAGASYLSIMEGNLAVLKEALNGE